MKSIILSLLFLSLCLTFSESLNFPKLKKQKYLTLENGLNALLISEPRNPKSGAALTVQVGSFIEPDEIPGLAHFLEHMLFLGNAKYPTPGSWFEYIGRHKGNANAYTDSQITNYFFTIESGFLKPSLDRWAPFFASPLISTNSSEKEVNAVNSEHVKNLILDVRKFMGVLMNQSNPAYPFHRFRTGNLDTLVTIPKARGIDIQQRLVQLFNNYYSANIMNLVLFGNESLETLESYAQEFFSKIPNKNIERPVFPGPVFTPSDFKKYMKVVTEKDSKIMFLYFQYPKKPTDFSYRPVNYLCEFLGNKGSGSIYSYLRKKGWAEKIHCRKYHEADEFMVVEVQIGLTNPGFQKYSDQIIETFFYYVSLLAKSLPTDSWRYAESAAIAAYKGRHKPKGKLPNFLSNVARQMPEYKQFSVFGPRMNSRWSKETPELLTRILSNIRPDQMRLHLVSNTYANETGLIQDPIYGTKFAPQELPAEKIEKWLNPTAIPEIDLPKQNPFVGTDTKAQPTKNMRAAEVMVNDSNIEFWYQTDAIKPRVILRVFFENKEISSSPHNLAAAELFVRLVKDTLSQTHNDAAAAGYYTTIEPKANGIELLISGNRKSIRPLLNLIWKGLKSPKLDAQSFAIFKKEQTDKFQNIWLGAPHKKVIPIASSLLHTPYFTSQQTLGALIKLQLSDVQNFSQNIFLKSKIVAFATGNFLAQEIQHIITDLNNTFTGRLQPTGKPIESASIVITKLKPGSDLVYQEYLNVTMDRNSCILDVFQIPLLDRASAMKMLLLHSIIDKPFYNQLRTVEQLGYIVKSTIAEYPGAGELGFIVVSERSPSFLDKRIENFLINTTKPRLEKMSDKEFTVFKQALFRSLNTQSGNRKFVWDEILSKKYGFGQKKQEARLVLDLTKADLIQFFNENFVVKRRKLSVQLIGIKATDNTIGSTQTVISDPEQFKVSQSTYTYESEGQSQSQEMNRTPTLAIVVAMMSIVVVLVLGAAGYAAYNRYHTNRKLAYQKITPWD